MNKQDQEWQVFVRKDKSLPEKFEVLSKSPLYGYCRAVDRYKDLLKVINFTKIADMLHLITHYGAVSAEQFKNFENSIGLKNASSFQNADNYKSLLDLHMKRMQTKKYLKQYNLSEIDCSLDKMFPNPISLHDEDRWYTVAARMLLNVFMKIDLEINYQSNCLHFTDEDGNRQCINDFSISSFSEFLETMMHTSGIFNYRLDWSDRDLKKFLANLQKDERFVTNE